MARLATRTWEPQPPPATEADAATPWPAPPHAREDPERPRAAQGVREDGRPPLAVLVHGITSSSNTWWEVGPALAERGWKVIGVDLRGHGGSPRGVGGLVLADLAADLAETIEDRPVDLLVGHSLGALVAMTVLGAEPGFARRVVLEDPPCMDAFDGRQMAADIERDARWVRRSPGIFRAALVAPPDRMRPTDADAKVANLLALDVDGITAALRDGVGFDVAALARGVTVPALLFLAEERLGSALTGPSRAAVATALARGWTEVVPCGHSIHRDAFGSFIRRLDAWLERVGAQPAASG
jgi:pimeloyl-ACP methyl ester carboxylesterase